MKPFLDSTDLQRDVEQLKQRLDRDGYLYLRGLVPVDVLEPLRLRWLQFAHHAGWVDTKAPLGDGVANAASFCVEPQDVYMALMHQVYKLTNFWDVTLHPNLIGLFEHLLNEEVLLLPNAIGRTIFPQRTEYTTPAHQDWVPIQGCQETYTCWLPMSDLPRQLGGLQLNAGSHRGGIYDFKPALGAGGTEITDPLDESQWVYSPGSQGAVVIFHSLTVHRGEPNMSDRLRLSIDARYQRAIDPVALNSLKPTGSLITWEQLYEDWPDGHPYKYYWNKWDLKVNEHDTRFVEKRDDMAFEMARAGNPESCGVLERIISRDPDAAKRERAQQLLDELNHETQ